MKKNNHKKVPSMRGVSVCGPKSVLLRLDPWRPGWHRYYLVAERPF